MVKLKKDVEKEIKSNYDRFMESKFNDVYHLELVFTLNSLLIASNAYLLSALDNYELRQYNEGLYEEAFETILKGE